MQPHGRAPRLCAGGGDAFLGESGEGRVQFDPHPVPPVGLGHDPDRAGSEERIEDHPGYARWTRQ